MPKPKNIFREEVSIEIRKTALDELLGQRVSVVLEGMTERLLGKLLRWDDLGILLEEEVSYAYTDRITKSVVFYHHWRVREIRYLGTEKAKVVHPPKSTPQKNGHG